MAEAGKGEKKPEGAKPEGGKDGGKPAGPKKSKLEQLGSDLLIGGTLGL